MRRRHYLKNADLAGEQLGHVVRDGKGRWVVLLGWSAVAWHLKVRDQWIAWSEDQREGPLPLVAQDSQLSGRRSAC